MTTPGWTPGGRQRRTDTSGNTPFAREYATELVRIVQAYEARRPRSLQQHLGPSELGYLCDRQVVGKMARQPNTNHVVNDTMWASFMGGAGHAAMEEVFKFDNEQNGGRWLIEFKVKPDPLHPGTGDLFDAKKHAVADHKFLADTVSKEVKTNGPPLNYRVQMFLYALGYLKLGLTVERTLLLVWPRQKSTLRDFYVHEEPYGPAEIAETHRWLDVTAARRVQAQEVLDGNLTLDDISATPDSHECFFCPFYRPEKADHPEVPGCVGHVKR